MHNALLITQIVVALLLSLLILIQERGSGLLGEGIAGTGGATIQVKKRGAERVLAQITVVMIVVFLGLSLSLNFVQ